MHILLIGSGGREHALAIALRASPLCDRLSIAPGNPGTAGCGENVALDVGDHAGVAAWCRAEDVEMVVVGPEAPLVAGLVDALEAAGVKAFGPTAAAARLEGSKAFAKALAAEVGAPTAAFATFDDPEAAKAHVRKLGGPAVVKADGLAAGKGVVVAEDVVEAEAAVDALLRPGATIVIEERLHGEEASFFALCDGEHAVPFGHAQDHKRALDGDRGPNTGGMGAFSPSPLVTPDVEADVMARIVRPVLAGMRERGTPFRGVLYAGLMLTADGPKLIEFNTRFGDPEAQVLLPRLRTDLAAVMLAACEGVLDEVEPSWSDLRALTVVVAAKGYPGAAEAGAPVRGVEAAEAVEGVTVHQAGAAIRDGALVAAGGRVLAVTAVGESFAEARGRAYEAVGRIDLPGGFHRTDIGARAAERG